MEAESTQSRSRAGRFTALACIALLALFAGLAWFAIESKCATFDEPLHATSAYVSTFDADFRIDPEDPPLWKYWAMIPQHPRDLFVDRADKGWTWAIDEPRNQSLWAEYVMYQTTTIDGVAFLSRSRAMFVIIGVILGATLALWAYRIAGSIAAIVATMLFSLDPNFLAHTPLVKNDVSITLLMLLFMIAVYRMGRRATWLNILAVGVTLGAALSVKFSGVLLIPMLAVAMLIRVAIREPWKVFAQDLAKRSTRFLASIVISCIAILIAWSVIWASYRFRFAAGPNGEQIDLTRTIQTIADNRFYLREHRWPSVDESRGWEQTPMVELCLFANRHHLLPNAWLAGFLFTYSSSLVRPAFLLGRIYDTGCWYYFPLTMLFKMPVATLLAMIGGVVLGIVGLGKLLRGMGVSPVHSRLKPQTRGRDARAATEVWWRLVCLWVPIAIYGISAMTSNLNLGIRHLLPILPFVYILIGCAGASLHRARPRVFKTLAILLALGLAVETFAACPDYIPFFNAAVGGKQAGLKLLGDSNLDWGQDLPAVAVWQQSHAETPLYLMYFGRCSADVYDIQRLTTLDRPCVLAISATTLQGTYLPPGQKQILRPLWDVKPMEVLDGTIYLYRFPEDMPAQSVAEDVRRLVEDAQKPPTTMGDR